MIEVVIVFSCLCNTSFCNVVTLTLINNDLLRYTIFLDELLTYKLKSVKIELNAKCCISSRTSNLQILAGNTLSEKEKNIFKKSN